MFQEHFFWRYTNSKLMPSSLNFGYTEEALHTGCAGLWHYLHILQAAGLLGTGGSDSITQDPRMTVSKQTVCHNLCRLIMLPLGRMRRLPENQMGTRRVRHGCHPYTLAAILEAAGPKGSGHHGEVHQEYTTPGLYACDAQELTPLTGYASRAAICAPNEGDFDAYNWNAYVAKPFVQCVFTGRETRGGEKSLAVGTKDIVRSMGGDMQRIYKKDEYVVWDTLEIWIGVPPDTKTCQYGAYRVAPGYDGTRRSTRLIKTTPMNRDILRWV